MPVLARFYEDIEVGGRFGFGARVFDADYIKTFAVRFDPQPFHTDEESARKSHFGGLCASGWQTASTWMRFYVEYNLAMREEARARAERLPELGVSPGIERVNWERPVYVGDEISFSETICAKRGLKSRPGWGMVSALCEGHNQNGDRVISFIGKTFVQMRGDD